MRNGGRAYGILCELFFNRDLKNGVVGSGGSGIKRDTGYFLYRWEKSQPTDGRVTENNEEMMVQGKENGELWVHCP